MTDEDIAELASEIERADTVVALTGAGVSTASGVPSFRGEDGIWDQFDQREFHYQRFRTDPEGFWTDRLDLRETFFGDEDIEPNPAHEALVELETAGHLDAVVTQNVDGLHDTAGTETLIQLHGTNQECACDSCGARQPADSVFEGVRETGAIPRCEACNGVLKPAVVLFGQSLPADAITRAQQLADEADVLLAIGSSLQVQPAANLPVRAQRSGGTLAILNLESTPLSNRAAYDIRADVTTALPELADLLA